MDIRLVFLLLVSSRYISGMDNDILNAKLTEILVGARSAEAGLIAS